MSLQSSRSRYAIGWRFWPVALLAPLVSGQAPAAEMLADINPTATALGSNDSFNAHASLGSKTLFAMDDGTHGLELWQTDGPPAGTTLVKDIFPGPTGSDISYLTELNGRVVFWATDDTNGTELWVSDGTTSGTHIVANIDQGPGQSATITIARSIPQMNGAVYFPATDTSGGNELWRSDGTPTGTWRVADINPGSASSEPENLTPLGNHVFFVAQDGNSGRELWVTDGTTAGTHRVKDIAPGIASSNPSDLTATDIGLFFAADDRSKGPELWRADASGTDASLVADVIPGRNGCAPRNIVSLGNKVIFKGVEGAGAPSDSSPNELGEPFVSDGTAAGTLLLRDINAGGAGSVPEDMTRIGNRVVFHLKYAPAAESSLWSTDGTVAGTVPLAPQPFDFYIWHTMVAVNGKLYFKAFAGPPGSETDIWSTDGTQAGTGVYARLPQPALGSGELVAAAGRLYFEAGSCCTDNGMELWTSDGTAAGTGVLLDINPGAASSSPSGIFFSNGALYFFANDGVHGAEPWTSDGTAAGTQPLGDFNRRVLTASSGLQTLAVLGTRTLFVADDGSHGGELWVTDGTAAGTRLLRDIYPGPNRSMGAQSATTINGIAYFAADDGANGNELWRSDGTESGTYMVADISPGTVKPPQCDPRLYCPPPDPNPRPAGSDPYVYLPGTAFSGLTLKGDLYFTADDGTHGRELWRSDGTAAGTVMVADLSAGAAASVNLQLLSATTDRVFFCFNDGSGARLWVTDGTAQGTLKVTDAVSCQVSYAMTAATFQGIVYFVGETATEGVELWRSDGTAAGTYLFADIAPGSAWSNPRNLAVVGGRLSFTACTSIGIDCGFYLSDGSVAGTARVPGIPAPDSLVTLLAGGLVFIGRIDATTIGTYISNGTASGTRELLPHQRLPQGIYPDTAVDYLGKIIFTADDGLLGPAVWATDGTAAGTSLVFDSQPGTKLERPPFSYSVVGNTLVFAADDSLHGYELWAIPGGAPSATSDSAQAAFNSPVQVDVLSNDGFVANPLDPSSVTLSTAPQHGTTSVNTATGVVTYTPEAGFSGLDEMVYSVSDIGGRASNSATIAVFVTAPPGDAPGTAPTSPTTTPPPTSSGDSGGGGGLSTTELAILGLLVGLILCRRHGLEGPPATQRSLRNR